MRTFALGMPEIVRVCAPSHSRWLLSLLFEEFFPFILSTPVLLSLIMIASSSTVFIVDFYPSTLVNFYFSSIPLHDI